MVRPHRGPKLLKKNNCEDVVLTGRKKFSKQHVTEIEKIFQLEKTYHDKSELKKQRDELWKGLEVLVNDLYPTLVQDEKVHIDRRHERAAFEKVGKTLDEAISAIEEFQNMRPHSEIMESTEECARQEMLHPEDFAPAEILAELEKQISTEIDDSDPFIEPVLRDLAVHYDVPLATLVSLAENEYFSRTCPVAGFPNLYLPQNALLSILKLYHRGLHRVERQRKNDLAGRKRSRIHSDTLVRQRMAAELARLWERFCHRKIATSANTPFIQYFQIVYSYLGSYTPKPASIKSALQPYIAKNR